MSALIRAAMSAGPVLLGLALPLLPAFYLSWRSARAPKQRLPLPFYLFASLGSSVLMYGVGTAAGIWLACSSPDSGNLCGLAGFFGLGPLLSGLAIAATAFWLAHNARRGADSGVILKS